MSHDVALFFTGLTAIAIAFLLFKPGSAAPAETKAIGGSLSSIYGTVITGNPQFDTYAKGYA